MPTIDENRFFTVMVEFDVEPQYQQVLIDEITDQVEQHFTHFTGFVSASFHASDNGRRVVNYGQWLSKEAWMGSSSATGFDAAKATIAEVIKRCGARTTKVDFFQVARVIEGA
ncbi:antibiotic biosynthesis monooxygenase [Halobacillus shinanisalinarum]|uniref:Antibiotic biosynthesis monooxygenase n=1 Tax=Halobacillus shinanisalinarum TaxID=2932258 RepID=A0ABY4H2W6_9BACI|nr:antibiotic biosynthesis monooxygenase [Halobacillus shinanisalinarum]UOQ94796.1 antibiotic biosynthesis monooxygenase [Halobacillus shinanisalinarum]